MAKAAKKIAVKSKQSTKPKPKAKAMAKPVSKPAAKSAAKKVAKPATKTKSKTATVKPAKKVATKPVAQKSALTRKPMATGAAKPKMAPTKKPTTSVVKAATKSKVADERGSALEPKPGTVARKPTTTVTKKKSTGRSSKNGEVETDRYEAARPGTAIIARSQARPVQTQGVDGSKSPFDSKELKTWRAILMQKRAELTDDIADLRKDAMDSEDGHTTPNHIAERGSDADLQDLNLGVADQEEMLLHQIDRALRKIELGRPIAYGLCEHTSQPIPTNRLELMPWTPISIQGAEHMEQNGLSIEDILIED